LKKTIKMRPILYLTLLTFALSAVGQNSRNDQHEKLVEFLKESQAVGISAGYAVDGKVSWQSAAGYADISENRLFETSTKLRIASIAKSMTALAVMQLWEAGKLDLDAPIQTYIPEYPKQAQTQITIRHLLSHTPGIAGYKNLKEQNNTKEYKTLTDALSIFKNRPLLFEPGTKYSYTTYGYTVLGVIIERVSGDSFEEYMQQNIWDKAGMTNTGVAKFGINLEGASKIYRRKGGKGKAREGMETNLSDRIPGGGFYTTVTDILKFGNAVIKNVFVKRKTLDFMREHHSLEKERNGYGFGWFLYGARPNEGEIIGHSGAQMGASSQLWIVPEKKVVTVVLANTSRVEVGGFANELLRKALDEVKE
jgi:CubicO group peptidase (beta-lactamase class C family)